eukprot:TRINITY_DN5757_c0_g1_i3.p1 TRINITY_DN5757_c0_g1~~TRINITY_DN5757_c0_g1_i3.p1  ORF type:complete len:399 (-),score=60.48 TRINITY_DN5757_c0_g1_i3:77-1273(-)
MRLVHLRLLPHVACVGVALCLCLVGYSFLSIGLYRDAMPHTTVRTLEDISAVSDAEWYGVLRFGAIVHGELYRPKISAVSEKHILLLAAPAPPAASRIAPSMPLSLLPHTTLYKAVVKLSAPVPLFSFWGFDPPLLDVHESHEAVYRRYPRTIQGIPELAATHLDRILKNYRKPPAVSRYVSSRVLYGQVWRFWGVQCVVGGVHALKRCVRMTVLGLLPEFRVPVVIAPWMDGLYEDPPSLAMKRYLVEPELRLPPLSMQERMLEVSDVLVFDYLVDEHDRAWVKNWVSHDGQILQWDNGLAFNHGPFGYSNCMDILCGPVHWIEDPDVRCQPICRFRLKTIEQLRLMAPGGAGVEDSLGERLRLSIASEDIFHPFEFLMFEHFKNDPDLVSFRVRYK